jgi:hypothetical protein
MNEIDGDSFAQTFGCSKCRVTPETDTAFNSLPYKKIKTIYDKSDSAFFISECCFCNQPYLEEYMDFNITGGWDDDPMWTYWMPLKAKEVAILYKDDVSLNEVKNIMSTRSFLINEKRDESTFEWSKPWENKWAK